MLQQELFLDANEAGEFGVTATPEEVTLTIYDAIDGDVVPDWTLNRDKTGELFNALGAWLSDGGLPVEIEPRERMAIFGEVHLERQAQDARWGGAEHDDNHTADTDGACWRRLVDQQIDRADLEHEAAANADDALRVQRSRYVKMAALAVAGIESIDRLMREDERDAEPLS